MKNLLFLFLFLPILLFADIKSPVKFNDIDLTASFTVTEKTKVISKMNFSENELTTLYKVLDKQKITLNEIPNYISVLNKQVRYKPLTSTEKKFVVGMTEVKNTKDIIIYLARKKVNEL